MRLRRATGCGVSLDKNNLGIEAIRRGLRLIPNPPRIPFSRGSISLDKEVPLPKALRRGGCCLVLVGQGAAPTHTRPSRTRAPPLSTQPQLQLP
jgi:hypothetical protein